MVELQNETSNEFNNINEVLYQIETKKSLADASM